MEEQFKKMVDMVRATFPANKVDVGMTYYGRDKERISYHIRVFFKGEDTCTCCGKSRSFGDHPFYCGADFNVVLKEAKQRASAEGIEVVEVENGHHS